MGQPPIFLEYAQQYSPVPISALLIAPITSCCLFGIYLLALPKPIPGIPYNKASAPKLFGDGQAYLKHFKEDGGTFATYCQSVAKSLNAPLVQIFIRPFGQPLLILADFHETQALMHRKDFDRSENIGDTLRGLIPDHHLMMKTDATWKAQRRFIQDLMLPSWLHRVAAPEIYRHTLSLIELWTLKAKLADGRPFEASADLSHVTMDAVMSFCFGERFQDAATRPAVGALQQMNTGAAKREEIDEPVSFPTVPLRPLLAAIVTLDEVIAEIQGSPKPSLTWAYVLRKPRIASAIRLKEAYISEELRYAVGRLQESEDGDAGKSAVHHMVLREKSTAKKEKREPRYLSRVMMDEVYGFIFAGHETTSTAMAWGMKLLADNPHVTNTLRTALQSSFPAAFSDERNPTIEEIVGAHIPYLEATLEEIHRCGGTTPIVDRQAVVDTQLLGHHIPKSTTVACLTMGPSMMEPGFKIDEAYRHESIRGVQEEKRKKWDVHDMAIFKPERWIKDGRFDPAAGPQLAFGLGARACFGKRLAYLDMRILFTLIVWNFELLPCPKSLSDYRSELVATNRPANCYVRLREVRYSS